MSIYNLPTETLDRILTELGSSDLLNLRLVSATLKQAAEWKIESTIKQLHHRPLQRDEPLWYLAIEQRVFQDSYLNLDCALGSPLQWLAMVKSPMRQNRASLLIWSAQTEQRQYPKVLFFSLLAQDRIKEANKIYKENRNAFIHDSSDELFFAALAFGWPEALGCPPPVPTDQDKLKIAMVLAAYRGYIDFMKRLIDLGISTSTSAWGYNVVEAAVAGNQVQVLKFLADNGTDILDRHNTDLFAAPLLVAAKEQSIGAARFLLGIGATPYDGIGNKTPTAYAIANNSVEMLRLFHRCSYEFSDFLIANQTTCLRSIIFPSSLTIDTRCQLLSVIVNEFGVAVDSTDNEGNTILHKVAASKEDCSQMISTLVDLGASLEKKNRFGQSALELAFSYGRMNNAHFLVKLSLGKHFEEVMKEGNYFEELMEGKQRLVKQLLDSRRSIQMESVAAWYSPSGLIDKEFQSRWKDANLDGLLCQQMGRKYSKGFMLYYLKNLASNNVRDALDDLEVILSSNLDQPLQTIFEREISISSLLKDNESLAASWNADWRRKYADRYLGENLERLLQDKEFNQMYYMYLSLHSFEQGIIRCAMYQEDSII